MKFFSFSPVFPYLMVQATNFLVRVASTIYKSPQVLQGHQSMMPNCQMR